MIPDPGGTCPPPPPPPPPPPSPLLCIHDHLGGPRFPSGPGQLAWGSLLGLGSSLLCPFSIDGRSGVLRAADITTALGLPVVLANSTKYRQWPQPSPREMVRSLSLGIPQSDLYFFAGSFLHSCSSQTTYFCPICSHCIIIYNGGELFSRPCTRYPRGSGSASSSL